jgi:hypothetical protein
MLPSLEISLPSKRRVHQLMRCWAGFALYKVGEINMQRNAEAMKDFEGGIPRACFDLRQVVRAQFSLESQLFLRHATFFALLPDSRTNPLLEGCCLPDHAC